MKLTSCCVILTPRTWLVRGKDTEQGEQVFYQMLPKYVIIKFRYLYQGGESALLNHGSQPGKGGTFPTLGQGGVPLWSGGVKVLLSRSGGGGRGDARCFAGAPW